MAPPPRRRPAPIASSISRPATRSSGLRSVQTVTTTIEDGKDKDVATTTMEVADLRITSLEASLFDVPPGYSEVKSYRTASVGRGWRQPRRCGVRITGGRHQHARAKETGRHPDRHRRSGRQERPLDGGADASQRSDSLAEQGAVRGAANAGASQADLDRDATGKACDFILVTEIAEVKTSKPNKVGGALRRVSGDANAASEIHDARVDYRLYAVGDQARPKLASSTKASSGGGFGVGSALRVAAFAGQMYMTMGMGFGMGGE